MDLNNWTEAEVNRAESSWGQKVPDYSKDMFDFLIDGQKSWLDLGCGFGRFLRYLESKVEEPDYIGYDSSADMISRIRENFPAYTARTFLRNITEPIDVAQEAILCSAVLIHLAKADQDKVLKAIFDAKPIVIAFDINSPAESCCDKQVYTERRIKGSEGAFRMTWQSHYVFTKKILSMFEPYNVTVKFYDVQGDRHKVVYMLRRKVI